MPKCKNCGKEFKPVSFNRKLCVDDACNDIYYKSLVDKAINKAKKQKREYNKKHSNKNKSYLQDEINKLARMIDERLGFTTCVDCGKPMDSKHAAHLHNVGGNENLRYNLNNIHTARGYCNVWDSEHKVNYRMGLEKRYGKEYRDYCVEQMPIEFDYVGLTSKEIDEALKKTREIIRNFDKYKFKAKDARDFFNELIGIYKKV